MADKLANAGDWSPGVKTLVSPKSKDNLPTDQDREKQQTLPSGAATPGGVSDNSTKKDDKRDVPKFEFNRPDNDLPDRPRSLPTPGEDYGHPVKEDYNMPTRRHEVASRVADRFLDRLATTPSPTIVAAMFLEGRGDYHPPKVVPPSGSTVQRRQRGNPKRDSKRDYIKNKSKKKRDMSKRHEKLMRFRKFKDYKKWYNEQYRQKGRGFRRRSEEWHDGQLEFTAEGITFTWEQESPKKDIDHPGPGVSHEPSSPSHHRHRPDDKGNLPKGETGPEKHHDDADSGGGRTSPGGHGKFWEGELTYHKEATTLDEIARRTSPDIHGRARKVSLRLRRADPKRGIWTFQAQGSKGIYTIRVKGLRKGNLQRMVKAQVKCSCDCDFFRYQGPEYWAKTNNYLYGRPRGTAEAPKVKDPTGLHWACKHLIACFNLVRNYRMAHQGGQYWPPGVEVVLEWSSPSRVANRWLSRTRN